MATVLFISEDILKQNSYLSENVDAKLIEPTIVKVQDMYIQKLLGSDLYKDVKAKIAADNTLANSAAYKTLVEDYLQPCMIQYILGEIGIALTYKYSQKSVGTFLSDKATPAPMNDLWALKDKFMQDGEWYAERAKLFLLENQSDYPLFLNYSGKLDTIPPNVNNYETGLVLDTPEGDYYSEWEKMKRRPSA